MITPKRTREITGYTYSQQSENAELWFKKAKAFYGAAAILTEAGDRLDDRIGVIGFNYAIALELCLKAIMVAQGMKFKATHNLVNLCREASIEVTEDQKFTLELLTEIAFWRARYPIPKDELSWDRYQDKVLENHKVKRTIGNMHVTSVNLKTWPTDENCRKLWDLCYGKYAATILGNH